MKKNLLLFLGLFIPAIEYAQSFVVNPSEYVFGIGPSNAMTDIGGSASNGSHFLNDFNTQAIRIGGFLGYRKHISNSFSIKGVLTLAYLYGNDNLSADIYRYKRNQDFRTQIIEPSIQAEYHFFQSKRSHYFIARDTTDLNGIQDVKYVKPSSPWDLYVFGGLGVFYFNPQGEYNGGPTLPPGMNINQWYNLRPLSTEGEGLPGGPPEYSPLAFCIPIGLGLKYTLNLNWSIGLELSDRLWTSTDYIDDTHGNYFSQSEILSYKGPIAAYFANPSRGLEDYQDLTGEERGDPKYNDVYMFIFFCVNYHPVFTHHAGHGTHQNIRYLYN